MKETFIIRTEWFASISKLSEIEQSAILKNLFLYHLGEIDKLEFPTLAVELIWGLLLPNLVRNIDSYDKRRETSSENGKLGGRPIEKISSMDGKIVPFGVDGSHFIYLIYDTETNLYKIGETSDLLKRRLSIKRPTKFLTIITFSISSAASCQILEREVLIKYKNLVVSGDWLRLSAVELNEIRDLINQNKPDNYPNYPIESLNDSVSVSVSDSVSDIDTTEEKSSGAISSDKLQIATTQKEKKPPKEKTASEDGHKFALWYNDNMKPEAMKPEEKDLINWAMTYDTLIRLKYTKDQIINAVRWARSDDFWKGNFQSPVKLVKKNDDEVRYIDVFLDKSNPLKPIDKDMPKQKMKYNPVVGMIPDHD